MKTRVVTMVLLAALATSGWSQTNVLARDAKKIEALLATMGMEDALTMAVARLLRDLYVGHPGFDLHQDIVTDYVEERLSWEALKGDVIQVYARHFTDAEIAELQKFYNSPVGQKLLKRGPLLEEEIRGLARGRFDADLALLELRMKNRELDALGEAATFYQPPKANKE